MPYTKEQAKTKINELVGKFQKDLDSGELKHRNEQQTIDYYIRPFFEYLNWDFSNPDEVVPQEKISKGRADYGFRIDGMSKFYIEAKAFKEDVNNSEFMEQAINYAWLKSVTWTVLTNFKELKVFNAEWESKNPRDKIFIPLNYEEYIDKFDRVWLLSRDSFLKNNLDREAEEVGKKIKKTLVTPVMKQLFNDLTSWREALTRNIFSYSSNSGIFKTEEGLDEAVQRIIDRMIFIRVCEDRKIEEPILQSSVREWQNSHKGELVNILNKIFRDFDDSYDSKLFSRHPCEDLKIDNHVLLEIINNLYESSDGIFKYDFSAIEADILGNIYEEYLGYILKKGKKKSVISEDHRHKKEEGIYYTPTFIVDYIVKNTLGETIKQMKPKEIENIKVLDMACGSGSFLLKAFDFLLDYHSDKNELDFLRKKHILTSNIYGVDLDPKAIEIAQLNLLLRTLEKQSILPKLQENLKIGNSLIDNTKFTDMPFEWNKEFGEIIKDGGFDVIIGNPPYIENKKINPKEKPYLTEKYESCYKLFDYAVAFIENSINLLKEGGYFGFIVTNKFIVTDYGIKIRRMLLEKTELKQIVDVSNIPVFKDASVYPIILIFQKKKPKPKNQVNLILGIKSESDLAGKRYSIENINQQAISEIPNFIFPLSSNFKICEKLLRVGKDRLDKVVSMSYRPLKFTDWGDLLEYVNQNQNKNSFKFIGCGNIERYLINWDTELRLSGKKYAKSFISKPKDVDDQKWNMFGEPKIILREVGKRLTGSYDEKGEYAHLTGVYTLSITDKKYNIKYILALLNSRLLNVYYTSFYGSSHMAGGYLNFHGSYMKQIPIAYVDSSEQKKLIELVDKISYLKTELQKVNSQSDKGNKLQEEIDRTDKQIDQKVYEVYGLTKEEIEIVEDSLK